MAEQDQQKYRVACAAGPEQSGDSGRFEGEAPGADGRDHGVSTEDLAAENTRLRAELAGANVWLHEARIERDRLRIDYACLTALIDSPQTEDFFQAVRIEAAHQVHRWGSEHDAGKEPADWFWLLGYLAGKALHDVRGKRVHHIIAAAAALLNWHRAVTGESTVMRPGIEPPSHNPTGDRGR